MSKITRAQMIVAIAVLLLTGCATTPQPNAGPAAAVEKFSPSETTLDEFFLMRVNSGYVAKERTGEQQLAGGMSSCEQIEQGVSRDEILAFDETSDPAEHDNAVIVYYAAYFLCPAI